MLLALMKSCALIARLPGSQLGDAQQAVASCDVDAASCRVHHRAWCRTDTADRVGAKRAGMHLQNARLRHRPGLNARTGAQCHCRARQSIVPRFSSFLA